MKRNRRSAALQGGRSLKALLRSNAAGWWVLGGFLVAFAYFCRQRLHMIYPGMFIVALLVISALLVVAMAWICGERPPRADRSSGGEAS